MLFVVVFLLNLLSPWFLLIFKYRGLNYIFYRPSLFELLGNFFSYLSFDFLFFTGNITFGKGIPEVGIFPWWQLPLLISGLYFLSIENGKRKYWLTAAIITLGIAASFFKPAPNLFILIPLIILLSLVSAIGLENLYLALIKKSKLPRFTIIAIIVFSLLVIIYNEFFIFHQFIVHYPKKIQ